MEEKKESLKVKSLHDLFLNKTRYIIKAEWFFPQVFMAFLLKMHFQ